MPPYYIGGAANPYAGLGQPPVGKTPIGPIGPVMSPSEGGLPFQGRPIKFPGIPANPPSTPPQASEVPGSVLGAQSVRPTGDPKGYDPSYLQNLATAIGGLFSRPQGNLSLNPLSDLSSISPASGMGGNAPLPGLPSTWLQDALNGLGFSFASSAPTPNGPTNPAGGGGDNGRGRRPNLQ